MNWLAHAYLSKPDIAFRVGNILPDVVSITELKKFAPAFQAGIDCHRAIDIFTDAHPIVKQGIKRLPEKYTRYGGILTDVFYDHFLARHWSVYSPVGLNAFTENFGCDLQSLRAEIPPAVFSLFERLMTHRVFESYSELAGIRLALQRIDRRLKRPVDLPAAVAALEHYYPLYEAEFHDFFHELRAHVEPHLLAGITSQEL
jgi:acyl carrier protein phosphodiesterase